MDSRCQLQTCNRSKKHLAWVIKAKSPTSTICLSNDHEHTHNWEFVKKIQMQRMQEPESTSNFTTNHTMKDVWGNSSNLREKKSSKSYGVVVFSRTSYIAHLVAPTIPPAKKIKLMYMSRGRNYSNCSQATMDQLGFWKRDGWTSVWIKSFWREREKAQTTYCRRGCCCSNLLTVGRISGTWSSDFGAMRDARVALLRRGAFIQREVHTRNSGLAWKLEARSRINNCAVKWNPE
jgi:hypothetical protein